MIEITNRADSFDIQWSYFAVTVNYCCHFFSCVMDEVEYSPPIRVPLRGTILGLSR